MGWIGGSGSGAGMGSGEADGMGSGKWGRRDKGGARRRQYQHVAWRVVARAAAGPTDARDGHKRTPLIAIAIAIAIAAPAAHAPGIAIIALPPPEVGQPPPAGVGAAVCHGRLHHPPHAIAPPPREHVGRGHPRPAPDAHVLGEAGQAAPALRLPGRPHLAVR